MPSKRCATSAKRSENCSSAPVTNRMACQSRCEIRVQASRRRLSSTFSRPSTRRSLAVWGWACRSAVRSSKRTAADCGRARTCPAAPAFNSPCRRSQTLRRDAALVSRPKEQATRPRVLLWVKLRRTQCEQMSSELPLKADIPQHSRHVSKVPNPEVAPVGQELFFLVDRDGPRLALSYDWVHLVRNSRMRPELQNIDTNGIRLRVALAGQGPLVILI